jgi:hypothetical protein
MRLVGCQRGLSALVVAVGVLFAGCFEETPEQRARAVCSVYCECVSPGTVEQCVEEECLPEIPPVSESCLDCVIANANQCTALTDDCTPICLDNSQP